MFSRPKFSLSTFLLASALLFLFFALSTNSARKIYVERAALAELERLGFKIDVVYLAQKKNSKETNTNRSRFNSNLLIDDLFGNNHVVGLTISKDEFFLKPDALRVFSQLESLTIICSEFRCVAFLKSLPELSRLSLTGAKLTHIHHISNQPCLTQLDLYWLSDLKALPKLTDKMPNLQTLKITDCMMIEDLSGLSDLKNLSHFEAEQIGIKNLDGLNNICLDSLVLIDCPNLQSLEAIDSGLICISRLVILYCHSLTTLSGIERIEGLQKIDVSECDNLSKGAGQEGHPKF